MKKLKKFDVIIIVILLLVSFIPFLIYKGYVKNKETENSYVAKISVAGEVYKTVDLSKDDEFVISNNYGTNKIKVKDGQIAIIEADCSDSVCIYQGYISKPGQQIVCLPHKLIIEIKGAAQNTSGEDVISK